MSYNRSFIILNREEGQYCEAGATGYCKIEARPDRTRIKVFAQRLKRIDEYYDVYLISFNEQALYAHLGKIRAAGESGELEVDVDSNNVCGTGEHISKFNIAVVCKRDADSYSFPLAGYNNISKDNKWIKPMLLKLREADSNLHINPPTHYEDNDIKENSIEEMHEVDEVNHRIEYENKPNNIIDDDKFKIFKRGSVDDVSRIMNELRGVTEYEPFRNSKLKYKWWRIEDIEVVENILEHSIASREIFRHPLIKKMQKDSNYFLFGIVSDSKDKIKYLSFGFSAKYSTREQFYIGGFSNFYPLEGHERKNGDSGYWVVHVRVDNDNIVITV